MKPVTNGDLVRAKTDEELAKWIYTVQDADAYQKENFLQPLSERWWLDWLRQEAPIGTDMHGGVQRDENGNVTDWGIVGPPGEPGLKQEATKQ